MNGSLELAKSNGLKQDSSLMIKTIEGVCLTTGSQGQERNYQQTDHLSGGTQHLDYVFVSDFRLKWKSINILDKDYT